MSNKDFLISKIKDGTVLDHIETGMALIVLRALNITGRKGNQISVGMNVSSKRSKKKDIIKVENKFLESYETNKLALMAPHATVNIIKNYNIVEKRNVQLPNTFTAVFTCVNPSCISNSQEPIKSELLVYKKNPPLLKCKYCSRIFKPDEVIKT